MVKKRIAIILAALLILSMLPGLALGAQVTLNLSKGSAAVGDSIIASGSADLNEWVSIKVLDSTKNIVFYDAVKSDSSGNYSCTFKVPQVSPGNLTVVSGYGSNVAIQLLAVSASGGDVPTPVSLESISITKAATKTLYTVGESLDISGLEVTGYYSDGSSKVESISPANITGFDSRSPAQSQVLTITIAGKTTSYAIVIARPVEAQKDETIEISKGTPMSITVPEKASGTKIKVEPEETLPLIKIKSETTLGTVEMTIPEGTSVINAPAGWDGSISLPEVRAQASTTVTGAQQVNAVIEVGLPDVEISFDKAVRLLIPGQKGKSVGFIRKGKFTEISYTISQDDQDTADKELVNNLKDGKVDSANDLAIWTKHFTEFVAYTPKTSSGGSPSGGGGGPGPTGNTVGSGGGTIEEVGARVSFPANALSSNIKVSINKLNASSAPAIASGFKLLGEVYEISSDRNTTFAKPVTITLPFDRNQADKDKYDIGLYTWNNSQWVILEQVKVDSTAGKVSGEVKHFSKFAVLAREKGKEPAKDVIAPVKADLKDITGHWAEKSIYELVALGAISGYPDGSFKPDSSIKRAEFATILVKAFKLEARSGQTFADTAQHWAKDSISTAAAHGIVSGYSADSFGPDDLITREQMAVMISKAANLQAVEGKTFADSAQIADWAKAAVAAASSKNIISGYPDNSFRPQANATRAEAVTVVVKAIK
ncbi:MAG: S-layer homology domain-containing protein [Syntrophomonas sp.]|nr:S-layer homology domain-containing protein [Syntrophomonas sp.]